MGGRGSARKESLTFVLVRRDPFVFYILFITTIGSSNESVLTLIKGKIGPIYT